MSFDSRDNALAQDRPLDEGLNSAAIFEVSVDDSRDTVRIAGLALSERVIQPVERPAVSERVIQASRTATRTRHVYV